MTTQNKDQGQKSQPQKSQAPQQQKKQGMDGQQRGRQPAPDAGQGNRKNPGSSE